MPGNNGKGCIGLAGIEFLLFMVACMGQCFRFVLKTADNTGMFEILSSSAYTVPRLSHTALPANGLGCTRCEGTQAGQLTLPDSPYHMVSCSAIKAEEKKKERWEV